MSVQGPVLLVIEPMTRRLTVFKAMCADCDDSRIISFTVEKNRDDWAWAHPRFPSTLGHTVKTYEHRPLS